MEDLVFVTGNMDKVLWVEKFLGHKIQHNKLDLDEIQDLDPARVLEHKAREAYRILQKPVLVEDTALVCHALGRLPGPFIKSFRQEIGDAGICRILDGLNDRSATAVITFGVFDGTDFKGFEGSTSGSIAARPHETAGIGHGWDTIFIPDGETRTSAEMNEADYTKYSARKKAVIKLVEYLNQG